MSAVGARVQSGSCGDGRYVEGQIKKKPAQGRLSWPRRWFLVVSLRLFFVLDFLSKAILTRRIGH
ncbi:hypothetical protein DDT52_00770 [Brenneria roseae subsp. roseae]|nr:hypothetical protein DDT52_00770 [Brenneria roseae subsp. roseae]